MAIAASPYPVSFSLPPPTGSKEHGEVLLSKKNLRVARLVVPPNAPMLEHRTPDDVVVVVAAGYGMFIVDGITRRVETGDVIDIPPNALYAMSAHEEMDLVFVHARLAP